MFAGAGLVVGAGAFIRSGRSFHFCIKVQQLAAGKAAELLFELVGKFSGEGKDDFLIVRVSGEVSFAETGYHAESGKSTAGAAHATESRTES